MPDIFATLILAYLSASLASCYGQSKFGLNGLLALLAGAGITLQIFLSFTYVFAEYLALGATVFLLKVYYEYGVYSRLKQA